MIAASRDYTSLLSKWSQLHYQAEIIVERYGRKGAETAYQAYLQTKQKKYRLNRAIDELFKTDSDVKFIFESFNADSVPPNELATLISTFHWFHDTEKLQKIRRLWKKLNNIETEQFKFVRSLNREWQKESTDLGQVNRNLAAINRLDQQWYRLNSELMAEVGKASLVIKRSGLWLSVILGILLVLIGVVFSVRSSKSIGRWEQIIYEKEVLLMEIHHRVKNNLAVISGLLELETMQSRNPEQALRESRDRIKSMAMIHEILYQSNSFSEIDLAEYMKKLSEYICETYIGQTQKIDLVTEFDSVTLNINQAVPVGLILNEVLANAIEHGFEDPESGEIVIGLKESNGNVVMTVRDNGKGLPEDFDYESAESTDFTIITALVQQLEAEMAIQNGEGLAFSMEFLKSDASGSSNGSL